MGAVPARDTILCIVRWWEFGDLRPDFFTFSTLFPMPNSESKLTPAQRALLEICRGADAGNLFKSLSITLSLSITHYLPDVPGGASRSTPADKTLEAWFFTLELMEHLHDIAVEKPVG